MGLQIAVWLLFVVFVVGLVGLAVEHFHPSWVSFFRNTATTPSNGHRHGTASNSTTSTPSSTHSSALTAQSSTTRGATYLVPSPSTYTLVISVPDRCYIDVTSPPNSKNYVFASTIDASQSPKSITVRGPSSLELGAQTTSITVDVSGKQVGVISTPKAGYIYTFIPSTS